MLLSKTIDGSYVETRYRVWLLGVLSLFGLVIIAFVNLSVKISVLLIDLAAFLLSLAVTYYLHHWLKINFGKGFLVTSVVLVLTVAITGIIYFSQIKNYYYQKNKTLFGKSNNKNR